jgi:transposase
MGNPGTRYSIEFKAEAVSQVIDRGYSVREVASRIGVSEHSLYRWVRRARKVDEVGTDGKTVAELATENVKLKSELRRAQEERDILRKAAAYFAKESERGTPS